MSNRGCPTTNYNKRRVTDSGCMCNSSGNDMPGTLHGMPIAMAYVPWQNFNQVYDLTKALYVGTIFPELNKPFKYDKGGCR